MATKLDIYNKADSVSVSQDLPPYSSEDFVGGHPTNIELSRLGSDSRSSLDGPPPYSDPARFQPTVHLQIQTTGKPWLSFPLPPKPEAIPIYAVDASASPFDQQNQQPRYLSVRPDRSSGSCYLIPADVRADAEPAPLSTTTYRFGPGKPPQIRLYFPGSAPSSGGDIADDNNDGAWDAFSVTSKGMLTRAQRMRTRLGTFEWRYATRQERKVAGADSLLVLDRLVTVAHARNNNNGAGPSAAGVGSSSSNHSGRDEEVRTPVARLVRNGETRTPGSKASTAGNGGRLIVDLSPWDEGDAKVEREMAMILATTTAVMMLKKEVDRRRAQQIAIMASAAGGGG